MAYADLHSSVFSRKFRAFLRWMREHGIKYSDGLVFDLGRKSVADIGVRAAFTLHEGDLIATIPKQACLTVKTTRAAQLIEEAELAGGLALTVAVMYEQSLEERSDWYGYLQSLPSKQHLPGLWTAKEIELLLPGTELYKEDWRDCVAPLCVVHPKEFPKKWFTLENYLAAKTLVASRAFEVDEYHGFGMVPLADLFNHKTAAEDVHITSSISDSDSALEQPSKTSRLENCDDRTHLLENAMEQSDSSTKWEGNELLELILIQDVTAGSEIFNTYGTLGNAGLLHRYGFTEPNNPFNIVNVDLSIVVETCLMSFTSRHVRRCITVWRKLGFVSCLSQNCEYFEISEDGKPQVDMLILLFIMHLEYKKFEDLSNFKSTVGDGVESVARHLGWGVQKEIFLGARLRSDVRRAEQKRGCKKDTIKEIDLESWLLTQPVCESLFKILQKREGLYPSLGDDLVLLQSTSTDQRQLFHALTLRGSERSILKKCEALLGKRLLEIKRSHHCTYFFD